MWVKSALTEVNKEPDCKKLPLDVIKFFKAVVTCASLPVDVAVTPEDDKSFKNFPRNLFSFVLSLNTILSFLLYPLLKPSSNMTKLVPSMVLHILTTSRTFTIPSEL